MLQLSTKRTRPLKLTASIAAELQTERIYFGNRMMWLAPDTMLLGTAANVFRCVFKGNNLVSTTALLSSDKKGFINSFYYATDKTFWISKVLPILYRLNKEGTLQTIQIPENYLVRSITEDGQHNIWIGTDKGLCIYTASGKLIKRITTEMGLLNDCIYSLLPATDKSAVFASSNLGLSYVSVAGKIKNFSRETGLQENEFNTGAAIRTKNGRYYFGGVNGITAFYPAALSFIVDTPVIHIIKLVINDSLYNSSAGTWEGDSVLLNHNQNNLRIDLAALGLLNANEYIYKYRLIGFEKTWQTTYQPLGINYTLVPGTYILEISCSPILSEEKSFYKKFVIIISPPWWQTWWFRITAVIFTIGLIAFILQQFNHKKYLRKIRLLQVQQQIQDERERISRDLHDDIGAKANMLAYNVSLLNKTISVQDLKQVKTRMKGTSDDMMQSLRETVWTLKQENITTEDVWTRAKNFIAKLQQTYSLIHFTIEESEPVTKKINYNQALNLIRILQESVNNAIKHSNCKTIFCSRLNVGQSVAFTVKDDGLGFDTSLVSDLLTEGNGLQNMKQRAQESCFVFSIHTAPDNGTTITIKV